MITLPSRRRSTSLAALALAVTVAAGTFTACSDDEPAVDAATETAATVAPANTVGAAPSDSHADHTMAGTVDASAEAALYATMRTLWDQHMQWTYDAVVAFASESPGLQATIERLLDNQVHLGEAVGAFYGAEVGEQVTALLQAHIELAMPVLEAAKAGDEQALDAAVDAWYANAVEIGDFLTAANPHWAAAGSVEMMRTHITQTIAYASAVLGGDHASAIDLYDEAQAHMAEMADALSAGIIAEFPDAF